MSNKFPLESLKAQAIVARTMTLALLEYENGTRAKHGTDASDNHLEFQQYSEKQITGKISRAVDETRGQVLTYQGKFAYAMFHSLSKKTRPPVWPKASPTWPKRPNTCAGRH